MSVCPKFQIFIYHYQKSGRFFVILFLAVLTVAQYLPRMFISRVVSYLGDVICYIDK